MGMNVVAVSRRGGDAANQVMVDYGRGLCG
jgi:hypothetical protein